MSSCWLLWEFTVYGSMYSGRKSLARASHEKHKIALSRAIGQAAKEKIGPRSGFRWHQPLASALHVQVMAESVYTKSRLQITRDPAQYKQLKATRKWCRRAHSTLTPAAGDGLRQNKGSGSQPPTTKYFARKVKSGAQHSMKLPFQADWTSAKAYHIRRLPHARILTCTSLSTAG